MACNCIDKIGESIEKKNGEYVFTNLGFSVNLQTNSIDKSLPYLEYIYYPKKKDGTPGKKAKKGFIGYPYCPFCGIKYKKD